MSRRLGAWLPAVAWAALIFFLSSRSRLPVPLGGGLDKLAHLAAYAVLGLLLARAARVPWAVTLGWLYGASDEVHQSFVRGRTADPVDWLADAVGVAAGVLVYHMLRRRRAPSDAPHGRSNHTSE